MTERKELLNQEKIRTLGEKETYKYLGILEADTIKQVVMKEKIKEVYRENEKTKSIVEIGLNIENSPGDLRTLALIQTPLKSHHLTLLWITFKGVTIMIMIILLFLQWLAKLFLISRLFFNRHSLNLQRLYCFNSQLFIIFTPWEFFTLALADGLSLESEW